MKKSYHFASERPPIFVVGLPRTGSKLMMNIISNNGSEDYYMANEIQFFGHSFLGKLVQGRKGVMPIIKNLQDSEGNILWEKVVESLYNCEVEGVHWKKISGGWVNISKKKMINALNKTNGDPKAVYECILSTQERKHKGYGDKSGPNLYHLGTLFEWFPNAKIIHIIRDPRAIAASQHKRLLAIFDKNSKVSKGGLLVSIKRSIYSIIVILYILSFWLYAIRIDKRYSKRNSKQYMLIKFEDLINFPEASIKKICKFLSFSFDDHMLYPQIADSSFGEEAVEVEGKKKTELGMDVKALNRWHDYLKPWMRVLICLWGVIFAAKILKKMGYNDNWSYRPNSVKNLGESKRKIKAEIH